MSDAAALVLLPGSDRAPLPHAVPAGTVDPAERIELTLVLRRRSDLPPEYVTGPATLTTAELAASYGATDGDVALVRSVLAEHGVDVVDVHSGARSVTVAGPAEALCAAFGTTLARVSSSFDGGRVDHRHREGRLSVPAELDGVVSAVLGLDDRPQARSYLRRAAASATGRSYTPPQLGAVYRFPEGTDGSGQVIAILELGGGYAQSDLDAYFRSLGVPAPQVRAVGVDGGANQPGQDSGADTEVLLDIEVAGALAPGADIAVYFAPNTDRGFLDALSAAVHATPTPTAVSISWGQSEDSWTAQSRTAMDRAMADAAALGVTVCVAAGDWGSADGQQDNQPHVDFPAASPNALACGGTTLDADPATGRVSSEVVWSSPDGSATGGRGVPGVPAAVLAVRSGRTSPLRRRQRPGRARPRRRRGPGHRLPGAGRREVDRGRRDQRGGTAGRGADLPARPGRRPPVRPAAAGALRDRASRTGRTGLPGHQLRQQRRVLGGRGLGPVHRARRRARRGSARPAARRPRVRCGGPGADATTGHPGGS
jgi:kumamolisin